MSILLTAGLRVSADARKSGINDLVSVDSARQCNEWCLTRLRQFTTKSLGDLQGIPLQIPSDAFGSPDPQKIHLSSSLQKEKASLVETLAKLSLSPAYVQTKMNIESGVDQVEVGAFRVVTMGGDEVIDFHTSHQADGISEVEISASLKRIITSKAVQDSRIALFEYYHTHPWTGSVEGGLSTFDANFFKAWLMPRILAYMTESSSPLNLFAISKTSDGQLFVYESSYVPASQASTSHRRNSR